MSRLGLVACILVWAVSACGGTDDSAESSASSPSSCTLPPSGGMECTAGTGTVELHFAVSQDAQMSPYVVPPLKGTVHGDLLRPEHVNGYGPTSDAVSLLPIRVEDVDLTDPSTVSVQAFTASLCPGTYKFLGFLDVDANADEPAFADKGDTVTLPDANDLQFEVKENSLTKRTITFGMTLGCTVTCVQPPVCLF